MNHCAYCNQPHPAGRPCTCPEQQRAIKAWSKTLERHHATVKQGMKEHESKRAKTIGNWRN